MPLDDALIMYDVDVSWWVTSEAYAGGYYAELYQALQAWVTTAFPFTKPYYSNRELPRA